jgi:hypothetical protein
VELNYDPIEVRVSLVVSLFALAATALALAGKRRAPRIGKNRVWAWKASRNRVRIDFVSTSRSLSSASL